MPRLAFLALPVLAAALLPTTTRAQPTTLRDSIGPDSSATDSNPGILSCIDESAGINSTAVARFTIPGDQPIRLNTLQVVGFQSGQGANLNNFWYRMRLWDSVAAAQAYPLYPTVFDLGPFIPQQDLGGIAPPESTDVVNWLLTFDLMGPYPEDRPILNPGTEYLIGIRMERYADGVGFWNTSLSDIPGPDPSSPDLVLTAAGASFLPVDDSNTGRLAIRLTGTPVPCAPIITEQPSDAHIAGTAGVTLSVAATGSPAPSYVWEVRGTLDDQSWYEIDVPQSPTLLCDDPIWGWASATPFRSPTATIHAAPCTGSTFIQVRCSAYNACGVVSSRVVTISICRADFDADGAITPSDVATFVNTWFADLYSGALDADFNTNGHIDPSDVAAFINTWFTTLTTGCP